MKKKLILMTSTLLAVGLFASLVNNQGNIVRVEATEHFDVTIEKVYGESYSYYGNYNVCFADGTGDKEFWFRVVNDDEIYQNRHLTPNKVYTLANMSASNSYATISDEKFDYVSASLKLYSDENDYIGYEAEVELNNGVSYSFREAEPMSGEMVIDKYEDLYGLITLTDKETGSKFNFHIDNIEDGVTYNLSDFSDYYRYCYIGYRYWDYRSATFKRTIDDEGLVHIEASVVTEHGDNLQLTYNQTTVEYPLWVGGVQVTGDNASDIFGDGTASFTYEKGEANKMIVTLNNANITDGYINYYDYTNGIFTSSSDDLIINLESGSENSIPGLYYGINAGGNVIISGKGSLNIDASLDGIFATNQVIVESGTVVINQTGEWGYGISADEVVFKGGSTTTTSTVTGINCYGSGVTIAKGATVTAAGTSYAINGEVKNAIEGTGWTNIEGSEGETVIDVSESGQDIKSFKKVVFVSHIHVWATDWSSDDTHHWHACLGDDATDDCLLEGEAAYGEHSYGETGESRYTCTVCGHVDNDKKAAADTAAANAVIEKINALPQPNAVTINDGEAIKAARAAYNALTADQKVKVSAEILKKLTDDETAYAKVVADTEAANKVIELINALPNASDVTQNDKEAIEAARAAYEALTEDQKAKISNDVLQLLVNDENALKSNSSGLPAGAIVGIVIGSIFGFLLIACGVLFLLNKKGIINIPFLNKKRKKDESNN